MTARDAIFISHASPEDNIFTTWLGAKLSAAGYEVWADVLKLVAGQDWQRRLEDALRNKSAKVLMVGTSHGVAKQGVRNEIQIASDISKRILDSEFIIPLRLEPFDAPFLIAHAQYVDFSKSWASGLAELLETLATYDVPRVATESPEFWRSVQLVHGKSPVMVEEKLISNWVKFQSLPTEIRFYEFNAGIPAGYGDTVIRSLEIPVIPQNFGFITFADFPSLQEAIGPELPIQFKKSRNTQNFLKFGWPELGINPQIARNSMSNILRQGVENVFSKKSMSSYEMSSHKLSWFCAKGVVPESQIKFSWKNGILGRRQVIGYSEKRKVHWHYSMGPQVSMLPEPHIKLRGSLIFSENGIEPIDNVKKMHRLRRSFTKSWRNARWRDMMLSMLWWIAEGSDSLIIPFGKERALLSIPTITFMSPVSMPAEMEELDPEDEDDPDDIEGPLSADELDILTETSEDGVEI